MKPESKKAQLLAQTVGEELVVYDQQTDTAHRLNRTAALVWRLADGQRTIPDLAKLLHDAVDAPEDEDLVRLALDELDRSGLLVSVLPKGDEAISRRRLFSIGATLIPVVASVAVPSAQNCSTPAHIAAAVPPPPTVIITAPPLTGGVYVSDTITVSMQSCAGVGVTFLAFAVSGYTYVVDSRPPVQLTVPLESFGSAISATVTGLSAGLHTLSVTAINSAGTSAPASSTFSTALPSSSSSSSSSSSTSSSSSLTSSSSSLTSSSSSLPSSSSSLPSSSSSLPSSSSSFASSSSAFPSSSSAFPSSSSAFASSSSSFTSSSSSSSS